MKNKTQEFIATSAIRAMFPSVAKQYASRMAWEGKAIEFEGHNEPEFFISRREDGEFLSARVKCQFTSRTGEGALEFTALRRDFIIVFGAKAEIHPDPAGTWEVA